MKTLTYCGKTYTCPFADTLPEPAADVLAALRDDIRARGVVAPVVVSDADEVIDGIHRLEAACAAGRTDVKFNVMIGLTPDEKRRLAVDLNVLRRQLTPEQWREVIARRLKAEPDKTDRAVAADLKTDHKTVGGVRKRLEASGDLPRSTKRRGRDGKVRALPGPKTKPKPPEPAPAEPVVDRPPPPTGTTLVPAAEPTQTAPEPPASGADVPAPVAPAVPVTPARLQDFAYRAGQVAKDLKRMARDKSERAPDRVAAAASRLRCLAEELARAARSLPAPALPAESTAVAKLRTGTARVKTGAGDRSVVAAGDADPSPAADDGKANRLPAGTSLTSADDRSTDRGAAKYRPADDETDRPGDRPEAG